MQLFTLTTLSTLLAAASAYLVTSPKLGDVLTKGQETTITWSSVNTDPLVFSIYLVNFLNWPPFYTPLALDVPKSDPDYKVRIPCNIDSTGGYQINFINGTNTYIIYAQSGKFNLTGDCHDPPYNSPCPPLSSVPF